MRSHELARKLLEGPDITIYIPKQHSLNELSEVVSLRLDYSGIKDRIDCPLKEYLIIQGENHIMFPPR